jgi:hypothetical protein
VTLGSWVFLYATQRSMPSSIQVSRPSGVFGRKCLEKVLGILAMLLLVAIAFCDKRKGRTRIRRKVRNESVPVLLDKIIG